MLFLGNYFLPLKLIFIYSNDLCHLVNIENIKRIFYKGYKQIMKFKGINFIFIDNGSIKSMKNHLMVSVINHIFL